MFQLNVLGLVCNTKTISFLQFSIQSSFPLISTSLKFPVIIITFYSTKQPLNIWKTTWKQASNSIQTQMTDWETESNCIYISVVTVTRNRTLLVLQRVCANINALIAMVIPLIFSVFEESSRNSDSKTKKKRCNSRLITIGFLVFYFIMQNYNYKYNL